VAVVFVPPTATESGEVVARRSRWPASGWLAKVGMAAGSSPHWVVKLPRPSRCRVKTRAIRDC